MRIVADTNVLVSAIFWKGDSDRIMGEVDKGKITLVLSEDIIRELLKVLDSDEMLQKIRKKELRFQLTVEKIVSLAEIVAPDEKLDVVKDDPDDNIILECAKKGAVDFIVTNDNDLLKLREFNGIPIVTPGEFLS